MNQTTLINPAPRDEEDGRRVEALLAPYVEMFGRAPDALRLLGISPPVLENYSRNIGYYLEHPALSMPLLAMIRYLVSADGGCRYCVDFNAAMLMEGGMELETFQRAVADPDTAPLEPREQRLLARVMEEVKRPGSLTADAVAELREQG